MNIAALSEETPAPLPEAVNHLNLLLLKSSFPPEINERIKEIFYRYPHVWDDSKFGDSGNFYYSFVLMDSKPTKEPKRRIPQKWYAEVEKQ